MKQVAALAVVLMALLVVGAVLREDGAPPGLSPFDDDRDRPTEIDRPQREIERVLERRAQALEQGDARAFAATATGLQRTRDRRAAQRARGLGLARVRYEAGSAQVEGDGAVVDVRFDYGVRGIRGVFGSAGKFVLRRTEGGWRIRDTAIGRQRPPWEVARFTATRSPHFVVWAPEGIDPASGGLLSALEDGYAAMREVIARGRLRRRYLVVVAADASQARRLTSSIRGLEGLTALTDTEVHQEGPAERVKSVESQRLIVLWPSFTAGDAEGQRTVVAHELTHAAVAPATSGRTPAWLTEGLALYVSSDQRIPEAVEARAAARPPTLAALSEPDAIAQLSGPAQGRAYAHASAAAHYIVERFGERRLLRLYDAFNRDELEGEGAGLADSAVQDVLGVSLARLERDLGRWIASR